jgi:hypothetical protein
LSGDEGAGRLAAVLGQCASLAHLDPDVSDTPGVTPGVLSQPLAARGCACTITSRVTHTHTHTQSVLPHGRGTHTRSV